MHSRRMAALFLIVPLALGLAACGKSKKASASSSAISVEAADFMFTPATLSVKAGQKVTVTVKNAGTVPHNFSISSLNVNQDLTVGKSYTVTFTAPSATGDVQFFCEYHKDSKNMVGTLHVT